MGTIAERRERYGTIYFTGRLANRQTDYMLKLLQYGRSIRLIQERKAFKVDIVKRAR